MPRRRSNKTLSTKRKDVIMEAILAAQAKKRHYGAKTIELAQAVVVKTVVVGAATTLREHKVGPKTRRLANLMKKSDIKMISRLGHDITGE